MAASREGGGGNSDGLTRWRRGVFAALCALASFDALADPAAQAFGMWFFAVAGGCLACIVVELAASKALWYVRLAVGVGFALLNGFLYLVFLNMMIQAMIGSDPADAASGAGWLIMMMLAAWVLPAARLAWLLRTRPPRA